MTFPSNPKQLTVEQELPADVLPETFSEFYRAIFSTWSSSGNSEGLKEWFAWGQANLPRFHQEFDAFLEHARDEYYDNQNEEIDPNDLMSMLKSADDTYKRPISTPDDLKALLKVYFFKLPHYFGVLKRCNWESFFQVYSFKHILSVFAELPDTFISEPIYAKPSSPVTPHQITTPSFDKPSKTSSFFNVSSNVSTTLAPNRIYYGYEELKPEGWTQKIVARSKEDELKIIHEIYKSIPSKQWKKYPNFYKSLPSLFIHFKGIFEGKSFIRSAVDELVTTNLFDECGWGDLDEQSVLAIMKHLSVTGRNQLSKYFNFKWPSLWKYASSEMRVDYLLAHIKQIPQCTQEEITNLVHTESVDDLKRTELLFWAGASFAEFLATDLDVIIKKALSVYSDRLQDPKTINAWFDELPSDAAATILARLREAEAEIITSVKHS